MEIVSAAEFLKGKGFAFPYLEVLEPSEENYDSLLFQPEGVIEVADDGVRNKNNDLARQQFREFLELAEVTRAQLVITPEYSMPWETLRDFVENGRGPNKGTLWVLGCESISMEDLTTLKEEVSANVEVIFEDIENDPQKFLNPLAYVFNAPRLSDPETETCIVMVQFKTYPMGDRDHFESNKMLRGKQVYKLGGDQNQIALLTLICSDAFKFSDEDVESVYHQALIIHIQLNAEPRNPNFRLYRAQLNRFNGDETELICLNWARNIEDWQGEKKTEWRNISGSAWHSKSLKFDTRDEAISANHELGFYYTWWDEFRVNSMYLSYDPAVFLLRATKVSHHGVSGSTSRRRGPQMQKVFSWDEREKEWTQDVSVDDGFATIVTECGGAQVYIEKARERGALEVERIVAIAVGSLSSDEKWYEVRKMESFRVDTTERIFRITFCQDPDEKPRDYREGKMRRCARLCRILMNGNGLPVAIRDLSEGFAYEWSQDSPHQNIISTAGERATVAYVGGDGSRKMARSIGMKLSEYLRRQIPDEIESRNARQRVVVWYVDDSGEPKPYQDESLTDIGEAGISSSIDFTEGNEN